MSSYCFRLASACGKDLDFKSLGDRLGGEMSNQSDLNPEKSVEDVTWDVEG